MRVIRLSLIFNKKNIGYNFKTAKGFEKIYKSFFKKVYGICFHQTQNESISEEMVQDIFHSLWKRKETLVIKTSIEHYLLRAAKLEVMEYFRTKARREKHLKCIYNEYCSSSNCTEEDLVFTELVEKLDVLIDQLPCQCRNVFKLSREKGMNNKEIASTLLISEKAVEYHITKSLSFLKKHILI